MVNKAQMGIDAIILILVAVYFGIDLQQRQNPLNQLLRNSKAHTEILSKSQFQKASLDSKASNFQIPNDDAKNQQAFQTQKNNIQLQSSGTVKVVLVDDNNGSRHQKFILQLQNGLTVLVAHNIDLNPHIDGLQKGDTVGFYEEYEYSEKGGLIHWITHAQQ